MYQAADFIQAVETVVCPTYSPEALDKNVEFDGVTMHTGSTLLHAGDILSVLRVLGSVLICRAGSDILGISAKRVKPAQPPLH